MSINYLGNNHIILTGYLHCILKIICITIPLYQNFRVYSWGPSFSIKLTNRSQLVTLVQFNWTLHLYFRSNFYMSNRNGRMFVKEKFQFHIVVRVIDVEKFLYIIVHFRKRCTRCYYRSSNSISFSCLFSFPLTTFFPFKFVEVTKLGDMLMLYLH